MCAIPPVDMMDRSQDIKAIVNTMIAVSRIKGNLTMSLNGSWGCGKTFVLEQVEEKLREELNDSGAPRFLVLHYNCWQFDYYDEPLTAIVAAMQEQISEARKLFPEEVHQNIAKVLTVGSWAFRSILLNLVRSKLDLPEDFEKTLTDIFEDGSDAYEKIANLQESHSKYDSLSSFKAAIARTVKALKDLAKHLTIVVVVDELDRCLPNYAIKVLERLHHLFDKAKNCAVLLAVDKSQLDQTIRGIFGEDSNPDLYLQKFIHCSYNLQTTYLTGSFHEKYKDYFGLFLPPEKPAYRLEMDEFLKRLFHGLDMRTQERLVNKAFLLHSMCCQTMKRPYEMIAFELSLVRFAACETNSHSSSKRLQRMPIVVRDNRIDVIYHQQMPDFSNYLQHKWGTPIVSNEDSKNFWSLPPNVTCRLTKPMIHWWWYLTHSDCPDGTWDVQSPVRINPDDLKKIADCLRTHW